MTRYAKPGNLDEALALLAGSPWRVLAGATDFYPALVAGAPREDVLDVSGIAALRGIAATDTHLVIGACTTWTDVARHTLPPGLAALQAAAREVGSVQIQNVATVAGNLCNASPAADGVPPLLVLDAEVELRSRAGTRHLPLDAFILGNRRTARRPDELVAAVRLPNAALAGGSAFLKLGARRYLVISIAMVAARIVIAGGVIAQAAVAVGACSAVAQRLRGLEAALRGVAPDALDGAVAAADLAELSPIGDVRGTAGYRLAAARRLVARALSQAAGLPHQAGRAA